MRQLIQQRLGLEVPAVAGAVGALVLAPILAWAAVNAPQVAALLTVTAVFELMLLRRAHWGVYLIVAGQFFDTINLSAGFAQLGVGDFAAFAVLPTWVLLRLIDPRGLRLPKGWQLIALFTLMTGVSMMLGVNPKIAYGPYVRVVMYAVALMALVDLAQRDGVLERVCWIMAACGTIHALIALTGTSPTMRMGGLVEQPNLLGAMLAFGVIPAIGLLLRPQPPLRRVALVIAVGLMLVTVLFTVSRGTYISLSLSLIWWLRRYRRFILAGIVVGGALLLVVAKRQEQQVDFIERRFEMRDSSVTNRWQVVQNAFEVIGARPLFGVGFGQFTDIERAVDIRREANRGSHNFYLGLAASCGLPTIMLLLGFALFQARRMRVARRRAEAHEGPVAEYNAWIAGTMQALMMYHGLSLAVRGGTRITEWTMLALYCCAAALADYDYGPDQGRSISSRAGGAPSSSSSRSSSSGAAIGSPSAPR